MRLSAALYTASCLVPILVQALPQGGVVSGGQASIAAAGTNGLAVTQASNRAVIDWSTFDVGAGERVTIRQPGAGSILLNRIHDQQPSRIYGSLSADGQVILANPNGMVFGPGSRVDVAGLIATTANMATADFMRGGALRFLQPGNPGAAIVNRGSLNAGQGGLVALVAPGVENDGLIVAKAGKVQLSGGDAFTLDLYGDGLLSVKASDPLKQAVVTQNGTVSAPGGNVVLSAAQGAQLVDSAVNMNGLVEASSLAGNGGTITATADHLNLGSATALHADGKTGGGQIHLGGGYQGSGPLPWAKTVDVAPGATITANATRKGSGGEAVLWSSDRTRFDGHIEAMGKGSGAGGTIETSSKHELKIGDTATVSAASPRGAAGSWLLDPGNIVIAGSGAESNVDASGAPSAYGANGGTDATIRDTTLSAALNGGSNVILQTTGANANIGASGSPSIDYTGGATRTLTLKASGNVDLSNTTIQSTGAGALNTILWADSDASSDGMIRLTGSTIATNGGFALLGGGLDNGANGGTALDGRPDNFAWGNAALGDGITLVGSTINAAGGAITLRGHGRDSAAGTLDHGILLTSGAQLVSTVGNITLKGISGSSASTNYGIYLNGTGTPGQTAITTGTGTVTLTGTGQGSGDYNHGILLDNGAAVSSTGTGAVGSISLTGNAGNGGNYNVGIDLNGGSVTSVDGNINMTGFGAGSGTDNYGLGFFNTSDIESTGSGVLTLAGTGSTTGTLINSGVTINSSTIRVKDGNLHLTGNGGGTTTDNYGIAVGSGGLIESIGNGTLRLDGIGGPGTYSDFGVVMYGGILRSTTGNILVNATGSGTGGYNYGLYLNSGALVSSLGAGAGAATITLNGNGSAAAPNNNNGVYMSDSGTLVTSAKGNITVTGHGGSNGGGDANLGIWLINGAKITSTGVGAGAAGITLNGTGGSGGSYNHGIYINGNGVAGGTAITTTNGAVSLTGIGNGSGGYNYGIGMDAGAQIVSSGSSAGTLSLNGTSTGSAGANKGVNLIDANTLVTSALGAVSIIGQGSGVGGYNSGVAIYNGAAVTSTGSGATAATLTLNGTAGDGYYAWGTLIGSNSQVASVDGAISVTGRGGNGVATNNSNTGIYINGGQILSTGTGATAATITLNGTGGNADYNDPGIWLDTSTSLIRSVAGNILLNGTGGNDINTTANGIWMQNGSQILSTGTGATAANITLNGNAGTGTAYNIGIDIAHSGTAIRTVDGDILLNGTGGGTQDSNSGVVVEAGAQVTSTGTGAGAGTISLTGSGGAGTYSNHGIYLSGSGTGITSVAGAISLTGTSHGTIDSNDGILLDSQAQISSTGTGATAANITFNGTAATGNDNNFGVYLRNSGTQVSTVDGDIAMTGTSFATGNLDTGIFVGDSAVVASTGTGAGAGTITLTGTAGNGPFQNDGVTIDTSTVRTVDGDITLAGTGHGASGEGLSMVFGAQIASAGAGNIGITATGTAADDIFTNVGSIVIGGASMTGNVTINADSLNLHSLDVRTHNDILLQPRNPGTAINLGIGAANTGLQLDETELAMFHADSDVDNSGALKIGRTTQYDGLGDIHIGAYAGWNSAVTISNVGGRIFVDGAQNLNYKALILLTNTDPAISADIDHLGYFSLHTLSSGVSIGLAGAAGTVNLSTSELDHLGIGGSSGIDFGETWFLSTPVAVGAYNNWRGGVRFFSPDSITVNGNQSAGGDASLRFTGPTTLNGNIDLSASTAASPVTFDHALTLGGNSGVKTAAGGAITFGSTVDGAHDLDVQTIGNITFGGIVGGGTRLGALTVDPASFTAGATHVGSFALTAGTGPVAFTGTGLDSSGAVSVTTNGNILGRYAGTSGSLQAGTGQVNATTTFNTLDIAGAGATLLAGNIGAVGAADQTMANRVTVGGLFGPGTATYRFAGFNIGVAPPPSGGGGAPPLPPVVTPPPPGMPGHGSVVPGPVGSPPVVVPVTGVPAAGTPPLTSPVPQGLSNLAPMLTLLSNYRFSSDAGTLIGMSFSGNVSDAGGVLAGGTGIGDPADILTVHGGAVDQETTERTRVGDAKTAGKTSSGESSQGLYSYRRDLIHLLGCDSDPKHPSCNLL